MTHLYLADAVKKVVYNNALFIQDHSGTLYVYPLTHLQKDPIRNNMDPRVNEGPKSWDYVVYGGDASAWDATYYKFGPEYVRASTKCSSYVLNIPIDIDFNKPDWIHHYRNFKKDPDYKGYTGHED